MIQNERLTALSNKDDIIKIITKKIFVELVKRRFDEIKKLTDI